MTPGPTKAPWRLRALSARCDLVGAGAPLPMPASTPPLCPPGSPCALVRGAMGGGSTCGGSESSARGLAHGSGSREVGEDERAGVRDGRARSTSGCALRCEASGGPCMAAVERRRGGRMLRGQSRERAGRVGEGRQVERTSCWRQRARSRVACGALAGVHSASGGHRGGGGRGRARPSRAPSRSSDERRPPSISLRENRLAGQRGL